MIQREQSIEKFKNSLKKHSLKATSQRLAVHEAMMELGHASADTVTDMVRNAGTSVTTATVYNILSQLALLGIYSYRMSCNNKMYFDVNSDEHIHMYDCENHQYKDVIDEELIALVDSHLGRRKFRGYKIEGIDIQLVVRPTRRKKNVK